MHKMLSLLLIAASLSASTTDEEIAKISEAMGHLIGKNLQVLGLELDIDAIVRGLQDAKEGKESPLSEEDCVLKLATLQEESLAKLSQKNLEEADAFLRKNKEKKEIIALEEGKLQYEVVKKGTGEEVQPYNTPLVRYQIRSLHGLSLPLAEELVDLAEAIPGLQKALVGMKEGEERILYIHPDLGYEKNGQTLHENALLIFEVEILKADASADAHAASTRETDLPLPSSEEEVRDLL